MDADDPTPTHGAGGKARLAAVLGAAALAIPGGMLVGNAFAAGGESGATTAPIQQIQDPYAPAQDERPDGRDCPEEEGGGGSEGSGDSAAPSAGDSAQETAL